MITIVHDEHTPIPGTKNPQAEQFSSKINSLEFREARFIIIPPAIRHRPATTSR
jgi:hypothetical protein